MKHLTEDEIQIFLDGIDLSVQKELQAHIQSCKSCQRKVQIYQRIYQQLEKVQPEVTLSESFSIQVMRKIKEKSASRFLWLEYLLFVVGGIGSLMMIVLYSPKNWFSRLILQSGKLMKDSFQKFFTETTAFIHKTNIQPEMLLAISVIILLFLIIDKLFIQSRLH